MCAHRKDARRHYPKLVLTEWREPLVSGDAGDDADDRPSDDALDDDATEATEHKRSSSELNPSSAAPVASRRRFILPDVDTYRGNISSPTYATTRVLYTHTHTPSS
jgi:hypothetical protein